jgi:hypothetical protein
VCRSVLPVLLKNIHHHRLGEALILFRAWLGRFFGSSPVSRSPLCGVMKVLQ